MAIGTFTGTFFMRRRRQGGGRAGGEGREENEKAIGTKLDVYVCSGLVPWPHPTFMTFCTWKRVWE